MYTRLFYFLYTFNFLFAKHVKIRQNINWYAKTRISNRIDISDKGENSDSCVLISTKKSYNLFIYSFLCISLHSTISIIVKHVALYGINDFKLFSVLYIKKYFILLFGIALH